MNKKILEKLGLSEKDFNMQEASSTVSVTERIEAQILYTAIMTDTLLEDDLL